MPTLTVVLDITPGGSFGEILSAVHSDMGTLKAENMKVTPMPLAGYDEKTAEDMYTLALYQSADGKAAKACIHRSNCTYYW
jgi:hypothetical protein